MIGSSVAHALKLHGVAECVVGYDASEAGVGLRLSSSGFLMQPV